MPGALPPELGLHGAEDAGVAAVSEGVQLFDLAATQVVVDRAHQARGRLVLRYHSLAFHLRAQGTGRPLAEGRLDCGHKGRVDLWQKDG